jgi:hypothetical protein
MSGGPKFMKIADHDQIEISNLNRIRASLLDYGENKAQIAAEDGWALDPFAEFEVWDKGISKGTVEEFIAGSNPLDVFIDEMDSLDLKIQARFISREKKIPVLMATDNGDGIILDIERFDLEPEREIFHGYLGDVKPEDFENLGYKDWLKLATKIVGPDFLTEKMQDTFLQIGKTVSSVPQLGTSANIAGSAMAYVIRCIANDEDMPSGRYLISLEDKLVHNYNSEEKIKARKTKTQEFKTKFGNEK